MSSEWVAGLDLAGFLIATVGALVAIVGASLACAFGLRALEDRFPELRRPFALLFAGLILAGLGRIMFEVARWLS